MTWHTDTATDYVTALDALIDLATSQHVATVAVNSGGTGYAVDDEVFLSGGTGKVASFIVTSVSSGVVTGIRTYRGGGYTTPTGTTGIATTGGTGSGLTVNVTYADTGWTLSRREYRAQAATVVAGGSSYTVGQKLTVVGGTSTAVAVFEVTQVSGGAVVAVVPDDEGSKGRYTVIPSNAVSTTSSGAGTGCTLNVEWGQDVILQGEGDGTQEINIGIRAYQGVDQSLLNTTYNWQLFAFTDYNSGLEFWEQPGISPGFTQTFQSGEPTQQVSTGAFVPLSDTGGSFPITYYFNITTRAISAVFKVEDAVVTHYPYMSLGYCNALGTTSDFAFPMFVGGSSHRRDVYYGDTSRIFTGPVEGPGGGVDTGAAFYYRSGTSLWAGIQNYTNSTTGTTRTTDSDSSIYPGGRRQLNEAVGTQVVAVGWGQWQDIIPDGIPGTPQFVLHPAPGGDYLLIAAVAMDHDDNDDVYFPIGEIPNLYWCHRAGVLTAEDTITVSGVVYRVFSSGNQTEDWRYFAIRESY